MPPNFQHKNDTPRTKPGLRLCIPVPPSTGARTRVRVIVRMRVGAMVSPRVRSRPRLEVSPAENTLGFLVPRRFRVRPANPRTYSGFPQQRCFGQPRLSSAEKRLRVRGCPTKRNNETTPPGASRAPYACSSSSNEAWEGRRTTHPPDDQAEGDLQPGERRQHQELPQVLPRRSDGRSNVHEQQARLEHVVDEPRQRGDRALRRARARWTQKWKYDVCLGEDRTIGKGASPGNRRWTRARANYRRTTEPRRARETAKEDGPSPTRSISMWYDHPR